MKKRALVPVAIFAALSVLLAAYLWMRMNYRRPYPETVEESGLPPALVYAVVKAESGFDERAVSRAGAMGLMQLLPATAEFVCAREGTVFCEELLLDGKYNVGIGCKYLKYLLGKFPNEQTALCAYNAGEGTVSEWLTETEFSDDGIKLKRIPYPETELYLKKIGKFRKIYEFLYEIH